LLCDYESPFSLPGIAYRTDALRLELNVLFAILFSGFDCPSDSRALHAMTRERCAKYGAIRATKLIAYVQK
jgi:hypothetical protein